MSSPSPFRIESIMTRYHSCEMPIEALHSTKATFIIPNILDYLKTARKLISEESEATFQKLLKDIETNVHDEESFLKYCKHDLRGMVIVYGMMSAQKTKTKKKRRRDGSVD